MSYTAENLIIIRTSLELTKEEFATKLGLSIEYYQDLESGVDCGDHDTSDRIRSIVCEAHKKFKALADRFEGLL